MNKEIELTEEMTRSIDSFSSKKRMEAMNILYPYKKLAHGEFAKALNTSPTSLSNILLHFENFDYTLIDSISEGKRRLYYLTRLGREYVENSRRLKHDEEKGKIIRDSFQMVQKARESLNAFQVLTENWEIELEDALITRIECRQFSNDENQKAVNEFIKYTEWALVSDYDNQILNILKLLQDNNILQVRFSRFIEKFDLFRPVLEIWENGIDALKMYELLEAAVAGDCTAVHNDADIPRWDEACDRLTEGIRYIAEKAGRVDTFALYECFKQFLAGNQILSGFLAREVFAQYHKKGTIQYEEK